MTIYSHNMKMDNINLFIFLCSHKGIGQTSSKLISLLWGLNLCYKFSIMQLQRLIVDLTFFKKKEEEYSKLQNLLKKRFVLWYRLGYYKGQRLIKKLPLNGQRTHTNAKTNKKKL